MLTGGVNLLLIGLGAHAQRLYYPLWSREGAELGFNLACVVDLESQADRIESLVAIASPTARPMVILIPQSCDRQGELSPDIESRLNAAVAKLSIVGVVISTDPLNHMQYARWALRRNLSVLMDKPISTRPDVVNSDEAACAIVDDYQELVALYNLARTRNPRLLFSVMVQRRYHPIFQRARELVRSVFDRTNCPVTSFQSFHSDGNWRLPNELRVIDYHPFNVGYGACSHSGYHFFDIVPWLLDAASAADKETDSVDVWASFSKTADFAAQITWDDYRRIFPDVDSYCSLHEHEALACPAFGEIDAFVNLTFRRQNRVMTHGNINIVHNGFSQRGWLSCAGRDMYKGNGRLRHESHYLCQGPFQALSIVSYQSREIDPSDTDRLTDIGREYHCDLHVFRNNSLFRDWNAHEVISLTEHARVDIGKQRGHQEEAKRACVLEFVRYLSGEDISPASDLMTHAKPVQIMSAAYRSVIQRERNANPIVRIGRDDER